MSATISSEKFKHFLLATIPALGHIRAEAGIVCELVKLDPRLTFAVLIPKAVAPVLVQELEKSSKPKPSNTFQKLLKTLQKETLEPRKAYQSIIRRGSLTCTVTGIVFNYQHIVAPCAVYFDMFAPGFAPYVKETTPNVKMINIRITTSGFILLLYGKEEHGGMFNWDAQTKAVFEKGEDGGRTFGEVADDIRNKPFTGKFLPNPDSVKLYDYESEPQVGGRGAVSMLMPALQLATQLADASITTTTCGFEPESTKVLQDWYEGELGKKVFNFGPLVPFSAAPYKAPPVAAPGPFKPIYDCLGSNSAKSPPNPELEKTIKESGVGLIVDYVPQRDILAHPSLGSFLSHSGNNSLFESIAAGVLNVFWPFAADQPIDAAYMTEVVRLGEGAKPPARGGKVEGTPAAVAAEFKQVLSEIKGAFGERKRENLMALRQEIFDALKEGGEAQKDMRPCSQLSCREA
ncbi:hypothetical protein FRB96_002242 [Tulasnella sp. 330]|nr:hypothetical protein FRB96_002242 [Tulasnella sp. 330]